MSDQTPNGHTPADQSGATLASSAFLNETLARQSCAVSCRVDGSVTGTVGHDLLDLNDDSWDHPANIFLDCPIFVGIEDDVAAIVDLGGQITLPSVVLDPARPGRSLDIRVVGRGEDEFMVLATRVDLDRQVHFRRLREARAEQYSGELARLERSRFEEFYRNNPVIAFALNATGEVLGASNEALVFACGDENADISGWARDFLALQNDVANGHGRRAVRDRSHEITSAVRFDGAIRIVDLSIHSLSNPITGALEHYFALRDVTQQQSTLRSLERRNMERDELTRKLTRSNKRLRDFAGYAAHDIMAPIGRMAQFSELLDLKLRGSLEDEEALFCLDAIVRSAEACTNVVRDILELAQVDAADARREPCDVEALIAGIVPSIAMDVDEAPDDHLQIDTPLPTLFTDHRLLSVIMRNVLGNAWKYRSANRKLAIRISITPDAATGKAVLSVADNGVGFETGTRSPFDPFVRMSSAGQLPGTGLGLTSVRAAADALGWTAMIESEPDVGTTVRFSGITLA